MATPVLFAFSLCVLFCSVAVSSKPVLDIGSSKPSNSAVSVLKRVPKIDTVFSSKFESARDSEQVKSEDSVVVPSFTSTNEGLRRVRRQVITGGNMCPGEMIYFMKRCMTFVEYEQLVQQEDAE